jgi:hypothetical protein
MCFATFGSGVRFISRKLSGNDSKRLQSSFSLVGVAVGMAICVISAGLGIPSRDPAPLFKPTNNSIIGPWKLNTDNYAIPISPHSMVFKDDGTFYMSNVPSLWALEGNWTLDMVKYISGSGVWHIDSDYSLGQKEWAVIAQFNHVNGKDDTRIMNFYFIGYLSPYTLVYINNGFYEFEK